MNKLCWFAAVLLALPGCSSIIEGTSQEITVTTSPLRASCVLWRDGVVIAKVPVTPGAVTVTRTKSDIVTICNKPGYQEASYLNRVKLAGSVASNVLNGGLGWGIDSASGADNKYDRTVSLVLTPVSQGGPSASAMPGANLGDLNNPEDAAIITRFQTLQLLLDNGLITREEFNRRRGANLGALLRYTAPLPAADLGRPAPDPQQVVDRLRYLAAAFEEKSVTAREQGAERSVILEALLPSAGARKADPPPPVTEQMQAAAAVGRLERLVLAKVISPTEQMREKDEVFRQVQVAAANAEAAARSAAGVGVMPTPPMSVVSSGPGVWLGSYRTENQARLAWASLQLTHPAELGSLQSEIKRVSVRRRGVTYHLNAGPVAEKRAAADLCRALKGKKQFCRPTVFGR
ncbi:SPOR domain-containing protein [Telmatospirillum sp.]|uniref:SPOR domain-containing protein n=1 Tax=Telmatospirillum sp. TaxID=2079197 RepID=UPI0028469353|nr:SPOR domain-containing protein [Telmatospirillum sp.]MDR3441229.1 SPOR domain-containing protein [Telmatospirillum sp.]